MRSFVIGAFACVALLAAGCSSSTTTNNAAAGAAGMGGASGSGGATVITHGGSGGAPPLRLGGSEDPATCDDAASAHSYAGCDYWPTVTANPVWSDFDFAVVVANVGATSTDVSITGPNGETSMTTVAPLGIATIYLPWVATLKGADFDTCTNSPTYSASIIATGSAYHLTSTTPIIVYQFNALEFVGAGGPDGKSWASCPGLQTCVGNNGISGIAGCFSFSNDASLLIPTTAMTGNYRVMTLDNRSSQGFFTVTATVDGTNLAMQLSSTASVLAGGALIAGMPGDVLKIVLNAGDVAEVFSTATATNDLSGTLVQADQPVEVIGGAPCAAIPANTDTSNYTCDHLEETVLPIETLGKRYLVAAPTGAEGEPEGQVVRLYGNVDGTMLTYPSGAPMNAPATIDAGQVVDLGITKQSFEVDGDHELAVGTFLLSAAEANPSALVQRGDPSQSQAIAVEQFRLGYVFLAPNDYDVSFVDVLMPMGAHVTIDMQALPSAPTAIGTSGFGIARVRLGSGDSGAHSINSDQAVGIQVIGYGSYTSYQYPGGLDLKPIAPPPPKLK